jgi:DNA mismatch repair ATPase MutS
MPLPPRFQSQGKARASHEEYGLSGKSTLLRAVGANLVLAFAGAPVRAVRLRLAALTPGATLCIQDSLLKGRSRFFAEVSRIRRWC